MPKTLKTEFPAEQWNKKRVVLTILVFLLLVAGAYAVKTYVLGSNDSNLSPGSNSNSRDNVKGASVTPTPTITLPSMQSIGQGALGNINNIKDEINKINVQELATSSPQVQKILNDIKSLPSVPGQQAKDICLKVCNGL